MDNHMDYPCKDLANKENIEADDIFPWDDYLEATESEAVPNALFTHVEASLECGIEPGMLVEVAHRADCSKYWVASVLMVCDTLLRLRYIGCDDKSKEFWQEISKVHPLNWCKKNEKTLIPPEIIKNKDCDKILEAALKNGRSVPEELLSGDGLNALQRIKQGMKVEVQDEDDPNQLWIATVIENVGGRLLLRYDTPDSSAPDFWLFYTSERLFTFGWTENKGFPWYLRHPSFITNDYIEEEWDLVLETAKEDARKMPLPSNLFLNKLPERSHQFVQGMKLEAVHPHNMAEFYPATVRKVFDEYYFLVEIDHMLDTSSTNTHSTWLCTAEHPYIFPAGWAKTHGIQLTHPYGWTTDEADFDWDQYTKATNSITAPSSLFPGLESAEEMGFMTGMKLEAVNPENQQQICVSSITKITRHLLWIHLECNDVFHPNHIRSWDSLNIFPCGWCGSNSYPLKPPRVLKLPTTKTQTIETVSETNNNGRHRLCSSQQPSLWCPKIYFNYKCFSGPFLNKGKLAQLPKAVGPGPVTLVMREVLSMLISVAYKSTRVLQELKSNGKPDPGYQHEILKAKYKMKSCRAHVAVVTSADQVAEFCKAVCRKLHVCPYLFGPVLLGDGPCPEQCSTYSKGNWSQTSVPRKRKNITLNGGAKCTIPHKRKKKRERKAEEIVNSIDNKLKYLENDSDTSHSSNHKNENQSDNKQDVTQSCTDPDFSKKQNKKKEFPKSEMKTRGAKLPNFALQMRYGAWADWYYNRNYYSALKKQTQAKTRLSATSSSKHVQRANAVKEKYKMLREKNEWKKSIKSETNKDFFQKYFVKLESNPLLWTEHDVYNFLAINEELDDLPERLRDELVDGPALLIMNIPSVRHHFKLDKKTAEEFSKAVLQVRYAYYHQFDHRNIS